jgi:hypothetical protein
MIGANPCHIQAAKQIAQDVPAVLDYGTQGKLSLPQAKQVATLPGIGIIRAFHLAARPCHS